MKKAVFKFNLECGRGATLDGLFISSKEKVDYLLQSGIEVYFGEVAGKHSEVYGELESDSIEFVSDDPAVVEVIEEFGLTTGINPFNYETIHFDYTDELSEDMSVGDIIDILIEK